MKSSTKSLILPLLIILAAGLAGAGLILNQKLNQRIVGVSIESSQNLRLLSLKAPGMFCLGCSSSMEGYLGAVDGVQSVNASLATKKVEVIYDPSVVDKETILMNQILDAYGKEFLSDVVFVGGEQAQTEELP